ncbi:MAG TPA: translation elongation factor Ts [Candidatus Aminicenantes bacterium]|nr:translation elongation factor Ts [Candidatus Aminicenantes bacterium]HRY63996.1 translation elongation factor Ts [Candidatus Aminicenantes bacterium]HRZ70909.1 translation elongation factor Ts [Candidatus Aminicenantes bacterium]
MEITAEKVKELRERTGIGMMECKAALAECGCDMDKAIEILRKKGYARAEAKSSRAAKEGLVGSYIHMNGRIGVLVELNCESDFVARNCEFQDLVKELGLQIAAAKPKWIASTDVPADIVAKEKEIILAQLGDMKKPPQIMEKIVEGKLGKFFEEFCLLDQVYIRDDKRKVRDLLTQLVAKMGENIKVGRFARFEIGQD